MTFTVNVSIITCIVNAIIGVVCAFISSNLEDKKDSNSKTLARLLDRFGYGFILLAIYFPLASLF